MAARGPSAWPRPGRCPAGSDALRHGSGVLDRIGVHAKGDVVDEHAAVHFGEIHPALAAINERRCLPSKIATATGSGATATATPSARSGPGAVPTPSGSQHDEHQH